MSGGSRLKVRLAQPGPLLVGGAHDALSAKLVAEAGFDAVWASGFEISASHGVPDANILTMSDNLRAAAHMARAVEIPVIADCDNGYGNAINVITIVCYYSDSDTICQLTARPFVPLLAELRPHRIWRFCPGHDNVGKDSYIGNDRLDRFSRYQSSLLNGGILGYV